MDLMSLVIDVVILLVIVAVAISVFRAWRRRPARLGAGTLPVEARNRYVARWKRIHWRFLDAPEEAVQEADSLVLALLGEGGHPLMGDRLPHRLRAARRKAAEGRRRHRTEDLRKALLDYRDVFDRVIGPEEREPVVEGRRETA